MGVACDDQPRAVTRFSGAPRRSAHNARRNLRLVYRGLRHRRSEGRQGAPGPTKRIAVSVWLGLTPCGSDHVGGRTGTGLLATVLLIDVVDSAGRAGELRDRAWHNLLERHQALVRSEVSRFRGREAAGDRCVATFDGPIRALRCALRLREDLRESRVQIRASVHTGECEFQDNRLTGAAIEVADQILAKAVPGEIWVSGTTKDLVPGS